MPSGPRNAEHGGPVVIGYSDGGIVFLGIIVALAFGVGKSPNQGGTNVANNTPPAASQTAPGPGNRSFTPAPNNPAPAPAAPTPAKP